MGVNKEIIEVSTRGAGKSEKKIKGVSGALGGLAKQAGVAAAAYFGTRALLNGIKESVNLFAEQELAEVKLRKSLGASINTLQKYASSLQQVTNFGDELIMQGMAQLAFFIKDEKQLKIATKATLDLAAAKGMDLVQAADLVAKSVGSSTNALSRYGIAAQGAVGSEERLLSITDEIANLFGGQAEATTESLSGKIDQMQNAFGDLQEVMGSKLAPIIQDVVVGFTDLISVNLSDQLINEKQQFETLISVLTDVNSSTSSREMAIKDLEKSYGPYLKNINLEKTTTEDLIKLKNDVVTQMQEEIKQKLFAEQLREAEQKKQEASIKLYEAEKEQIKQATVTYSGYGGMVTNLGNQTGEVVKARKRAFEESEKELQAVKDSQVGYEEWLKTQNKVVKIKDADAKTTKELTSFEKTLAKVKEQTTAKGASDEYSAALNSSKAHLIKQIMKHIRFPFNIAVAAASGASIDKIFAKNNITAAQYGADFVTDGPQMMMVGEGNGPERVQVTPLVDPNLDGPQGGGMTINIQGSVIGTEQFTEDVLMPQIEEGLRLGNRI